jgi:hypothetical protein
MTPSAEMLSIRLELDESEVLCEGFGLQSHNRSTLTCSTGSNLIRVFAISGDVGISLVREETFGKPGEMAVLVAPTFDGAVVGLKALGSDIHSFSGLLAVGQTQVRRLAGDTYFRLEPYIATGRGCMAWGASVTGQTEKTQVWYSSGGQARHWGPPGDYLVRDVRCGREVLVQDGSQGVTALDRHGTKRSITGSPVWDGDCSVSVDGTLAVLECPRLESATVTVPAPPGALPEPDGAVGLKGENGSVGFFVVPGQELFGLVERGVWTGVWINVPFDPSWTAPRTAFRTAEEVCVTWTDWSSEPATFRMTCMTQ